MTRRLRRSKAEPEICLGGDVRIGIVVGRGVERIERRRRWRRAGGDKRARQKPARVHPLLADQGLGIEGGIEHRAREAEHRPGVVGIIGAAQGRRGADAGEMALGHVEAVLEAADQAGEVGALGAVEGVQLVNHQEAQRLRPDALPERRVLGADQQVVEHLVVGHQDVRRFPAEHLADRDDLLLAHDCSAFALVAPDVEADPRSAL
jgi:hypothetical protein